jgi:tetratricopeptide (TPR) repeat protein
MRIVIIARLAFCSVLIYVALYSFSIQASEGPSINEINNLRNTEIKSAEYYFNQGLSYSDSGNYNQAIFCYAQAIKINPEYVMAYNNRGNVFYRMGDYDKAIIDYNRAIDLNPSFAEAFNNRAFAYYYT